MNGERPREPVKRTGSFANAFGEIEKILVLSSNFVLIPLQIPGPDLGRELSEWLIERGHPVLVFEPITADEWRRLAASLQAARVGDEGVVMVIGSRDVSPDVDRGLHLVNQVRDTIARGIERPLLWCGPRVFLERTMDEAPDFWSVRAVERVLSPDRVQSSPFESYRGPAPAVEPVRAPVVDTDLQQRLSLIAREQSTNPLGAAHMSRATAEELLEGGQIDLAASLVEKSLVATTGFADPVRGDLAILRARIDIHRGRTREALASVEGVLGDPLARGDQKASALLVRGELREATGDLGGAETDYLEARDLARGTGDGAGAVRALVGLGRVTGETRGYDSEAIATLEEALSLATKLGDPGLVQSARETLAQAHRMAFDQRAADRLLSSGGTDARAPDSEK